MVMKACSTLDAVLADVSKNGMPSWSANSLACVNSTTFFVVMSLLLPTSSLLTFSLAYLYRGQLNNYGFCQNYQRRQISIAVSLETSCVFCRFLPRSTPWPFHEHKINASLMWRTLLEHSMHRMANVRPQSRLATENGSAAKAGELGHAATSNIPPPTALDFYCTYSCPQKPISTPPKHLYQRTPGNNEIKRGGGIARLFYLKVLGSAQVAIGTLNSRLASTLAVIDRTQG